MKLLCWLEIHKWINIGYGRRTCLRCYKKQKHVKVNLKPGYYSFGGMELEYYWEDIDE